jgi:hypothetical protein
MQDNYGAALVLINNNDILKEVNKLSQFFNLLNILILSNIFVYKSTVKEMILIINFICNIYLSEKFSIFSKKCNFDDVKDLV